MQNGSTVRKKKKMNYGAKGKGTIVNFFQQNVKKCSFTRLKILIYVIC